MRIQRNADWRWMQDCGRCSVYLHWCLICLKAQNILSNHLDEASSLDDIMGIVQLLNKLASGAYTHLVIGDSCEDGVWVPVDTDGWVMHRMCTSHLVHAECSVKYLCLEQLLLQGKQPFDEEAGDQRLEGTDRMPSGLNHCHGHMLMDPSHSLLKPDIWPPTTGHHIAQPLVKQFMGNGACCSLLLVQGGHLWIPKQSLLTVRNQSPVLHCTSSKVRDGNLVCRWVKDKLVHTSVTGSGEPPHLAWEGHTHGQSTPQSNQTLGHCSWSWQSQQIPCRCTLAVPSTCSELVMFTWGVLWISGDWGRNSHIFQIGHHQLRSQHSCSWR